MNEASVLADIDGVIDAIVHVCRPVHVPRLIVEDREYASEKQSVIIQIDILSVSSLIFSHRLSLPVQMKLSANALVSRDGHDRNRRLVARALDCGSEIIDYQFITNDKS